MLCRLCRISERERLRDENLDNQEEIKEKPRLQKITSITFDRESSEFFIDKDFFEIIEIFE